MKSSNSDNLNLANVSRGRRVCQFALSWLLTIILFVVIVSRIKISEVLLGLSQADIQYVMAAVLFSLLAHLLFSSARYQEIAHAMGKQISFFEAVLIRMGCNPIKGIFPLKIGELAIVAYMKKKHHLSYPGGVLFDICRLSFQFDCPAIFLCRGRNAVFPRHPSESSFSLFMFCRADACLAVELESDDSSSHPVDRQI